MTKDEIGALIELLETDAKVFTRSALVLQRKKSATALQALQAENERLREALWFYAVEWDGHAGDSGPGGNWPADPVWDPNEDLLDDGGKRARAALKDTKP